MSTESGSEGVGNNIESTPQKMLGGITGKGFMPGQSGNPSGRPKQDKAADIARKIFESAPEEILDAMLKALKKGNPQVFTALAERGYGKVPQAVEHSGPDGAPLAISVQFVKSDAEG